MPQPSVFPVVVAVNGQDYEGTYYVEEGIVYLESEYGDNRTQLGRLQAAAVAALMLGEIVHAAIGRGEAGGKH